MIEVSAPGGRVLAAYEHGDPQGRPVIIHHGTPGSGHVRQKWVEQARELGVRLISYDRAGYARSDRAPGVERFATCGASGGGPHALACGALLGERVTAVATFAGAGPSDAPDLDF